METFLFKFKVVDKLVFISLKPIGSHVGAPLYNINKFTFLLKSSVNILES